MPSLSRRTPFEREKRVSFYVFLAPWIFGFLAFQMVPVVWGFYLSLQNRMAFTRSPKFIGLENYVKLLTDPEILYSFATTFIYTISATLVAVITGFVLALLLENHVWGRGVFRTLLYFPYMIPLIAVGWIFRIFLDRDIGFFNMVLTRLGLISANIAWMQSFPRECVVSLSIWQAGWSMIIFTGGLSTIPEELYEVSRIDGANYLRRIRHITLPLISPFIFFQMVVSFIYAMQVFIQVYILNPRPIRGQFLFLNLPPPETFFVMARGFFTVISQKRFSYGLAMLWLLFAFVLIVTIIFVKFGGFWVYTEVDQRGKRR